MLVPVEDRECIGIRVDGSVLGGPVHLEVRSDRAGPGTTLCRAAACAAATAQVGNSAIDGNSVVLDGCIAAGAVLGLNLDVMPRAGAELGSAACLTGTGPVTAVCADLPHAGAERALNAEHVEQLRRRRNGMIHVQFKLLKIVDIGSGGEVNPQVVLEVSSGIVGTQRVKPPHPSARCCRSKNELTRTHFCRARISAIGWERRGIANAGASRIRRTSIRTAVRLRLPLKGDWIRGSIIGTAVVAAGVIGIQFDLAELRSR